MNEFNLVKQPKEKLQEKLEELGQSTRTSLSVEEKRVIRNAILATMREFPVREGVNAGKSSRSNVIVTIKHIIAGTIIAALLGGSVSYAAEGSLPGDLLYPVKISINEEVRSSLTISAESKAELHAELAKRRLEEAEKLAVAGRLTAETRKQIVEGFLTHAEKSESHGERAEEKAEMESEAGAETGVDIDSNFESILEAHEKVLAKIEAKIEAGDPEASEHLEAVLLDVRAQISAVAKQREAGELKVSSRALAEVKVSAESAMEGAREKIDEMKKFLEGEQDALSASTTAATTTTASMKARIMKAEGIFTEGKVKFEGEAYGEAYILFKKAERQVQASKLLMRAAQDFAIEINGVHATGTLDTDQETMLLNNDGKIQIKNGERDREVGNKDEDVSVDATSTSNMIKVNVGGTGSASVYTEQKVQVNTGGNIQIGL